MMPLLAFAAGKFECYLLRFLKFVLCGISLETSAECSFAVQTKRSHLLRVAALAWFVLLKFLDVEMDCYFPVFYFLLAPNTR